MKFCIFTDLHYDVIPDGDRRLAEIIEDSKREQVDFVVELGDLCHPTAENQRLLRAFEKAGLPCLFSVGNHNTDRASPETVLGFFGLKSGHYSAVRENVKFIFLDANYVCTEQGVFLADGQNRKQPGVLYPYIPQEQVEWLDSELSDERYAYIICSHQSLVNDFRVHGAQPRGIANREQVRAILERHNEAGRRVLFCMNGHDHGDAVQNVNGIWYYSLNTASYAWQSAKALYAYAPEVHERYLSLKYMLLYREALHSIVTIDGAGNVEIRGMEGHYDRVTPQDAGIGDVWNGISIKPRTSSLTIKI